MACPRRSLNSAGLHKVGAFGFTFASKNAEWSWTKSALSLRASSAARAASSSTPLRASRASSSSSMPRSCRLAMVLSKSLTLLPISLSYKAGACSLSASPAAAPSALMKRPLGARRPPSSCSSNSECLRLSFDSSSASSKIASHSASWSAASAPRERLTCLEASATKSGASASSCFSSSSAAKASCLSASRNAVSVCSSKTTPVSCRLMTIFESFL
mmetsp:Transcript_118960/g.206565  ORF Transcript_118960/g.206565 Transcript_118960/m.206565 type:complete len:216 (-) Transcript_118960:373-1020(-)